MNTERIRECLLAVLILCGAFYISAVSKADAAGDAGSAGATSRPQEGDVFGIITDKAKDGKGLDIKCGDPEAPTHYVVPNDKAIGAIWPTLFPDHTVELKYKTVNGQATLTSVKLISPTKGNGRLTGIVTDETAGGKRCYIEVKAGKNPTIRFVPMWDMKNKEWTKSVVDQIAATKVGDKVEINWVADGERVHLTGLRVVAKAATQPATQPAK